MKLIKREITDHGFRTQLEFTSNEMTVIRLALADRLDMLLRIPDPHSGLTDLIAETVALKTAIDPA